MKRQDIVVLKLKIISKKYGDIYTMIDDEFKNLVSNYKLRVSKSGNNLYIKCRKIGDKTFKSINIHNLITGFSFVDHINGNTLDNRLENLKDSNYSKNNKNASKRKDYKYSKYKGVGYDRSAKKWKARIQANGKRIEIGLFNSEIEAAIAYNTKSIELHGKDGRLNEIA